jgi:hypothetical protein
MNVDHQSFHFRAGLPYADEPNSCRLRWWQRVRSFQTYHSDSGGAGQRQRQPWRRTQVIPAATQTHAAILGYQHATTFADQHAASFANQYQHAHSCLAAFADGNAGGGWPCPPGAAIL